MVDASTFQTTVPAPYIDATGYHCPSFGDIYSAYQNDYRGLYGADVDLDPDTQDGQWIGIQSLAYYNVCLAGLATYNAFSPSTAQGAGLSSVVKINGIERDISSYSSSDVDIVGQAGATLTNCQASDLAGYTWALPSSIVIPLSGEITVTATCATIGAIKAPAGTITGLKTPTLGWQSITNPTAATPGAPVESDPALRIRQSNSTMIPALSVLDGLKGTVLELPGVTLCQVYQNTDTAPDINGIPGNCLAVIVDGGDIQTIADTIYLKKGGGVGTYGNESALVSDTAGRLLPVAFFRPIRPPISYVVTVKALPGFTTDTQAQIAQTISDWTNALGLNQNVLRTRAFLPANLYGGANSATFEILDVALARDAAVTSPADVQIAFNEDPACDPSYIQIELST